MIAKGCDGERDAGPEETLMRRLLWRLMPLIALTYFVSVVDKANVGFAKLQMIDDLGMSEAAFGFGASLFFLAMLIFELPSSLLARRFGLRFWVARIMLSWGVITTVLAFTKTPTMFYALRFLLGVSEAGLYAALLYYLSQWFPQSYKARVTGLLTLGSAFGNGFGSLLSGPILGLDGRLGLGGWQWLFLVTGALPLVAAGIIWRWLPSRIDDARFLSAAEREMVRSAVARDEPQSLAVGQHFLSVLWSLRVLGLSVVFVAILTALFGVIYWIPTVAQSFAASSSQIGLLSALPWAMVAFALVVVPPRLQSTRQISIGMACVAALGCVLFLGSIHGATPVVRFACIVMGTPCISLLITCFWTIPGRYFSGVHAAAALAVISTYGNIGGFFAQNLMPWAASVTGNAVGAMYVPAACLGLIAAGVLVVVVRAPAELPHQISVIRI